MYKIFTSSFILVFPILSICQNLNKKDSVLKNWNLQTINSIDSQILVTHDTLKAKEYLNVRGYFILVNKINQKNPDSLSSLRNLFLQSINTHTKKYTNFVIIESDVNSSAYINRNFLIRRISKNKIKMETFYLTYKGWVKIDNKIIFATENEMDMSKLLGYKNLETNMEFVVISKFNLRGSKYSSFYFQGELNDKTIIKLDLQ